jgi:hypothetical protein
MSEPVQTCQLCQRSVIVTPDGRGFPPDIAKRKLRKLCNADGCVSSPRYTAGFSLGQRASGQAAGAERDAADAESAFAGQGEQTAGMFVAWATAAGMLEGGARPVASDQLADLALAFFAGWAHADAARGIFP